MMHSGSAETTTAFAWHDSHLQHGWRALLIGATLLVDKLDEDLRRKHKISFEEYVVLVVLSEFPDGMLVANLGVAKALHPGRIPRLVTRMQLAGWITRDAESGAGADAWVRITDAGRATVERVAPDHVASIRAHLLDIVDRDDFLAVARVFDQVTDSLIGRHPEMAVRTQPSTSQADLLGAWRPGRNDEPRRSALRSCRSGCPLGWRQRATSAQTTFPAPAGSNPQRAASPETSRSPRWISSLRGPVSCTTGRSGLPSPTRTETCASSMTTSSDSGVRA